MTQNNYIPADYDRIKVVPDIYSLLNEDFGAKANLILHPRRLAGDFDALALVMAAFFNLGRHEIFIKYKDRDRLLEFGETLENPAFIAPLEIILDDMEFFHAAAGRVTFRLVRKYQSLDGVHDFHIDGLNQDFDRIMCCYNDPVTEYVRNDDVLSIEGQTATVREGAPVFRFRPGDLARQRIRNKKTPGVLGLLRGITDNKVQRAFVHRAQKSNHPRLMLVVDLSV